MEEQFDALTQRVAKQDTVEGSLDTLLGGVADLIAAVGGDPQQLRELHDLLTNRRAQICAAVASNTSAMEEEDDGQPKEQPE